jgi:hypothetical protein
VAFTVYSLLLLALAVIVLWDMMEGLTSSERSRKMLLWNAHTRTSPPKPAIRLVCTDCNHMIAYCWGDDNHIPETLWNRVCDSDPDCTRCEQNRDNFCALCEEEIAPKEAPPSEADKANDYIWNTRPSDW